jgi:transcriptional regulator with XRE-family HTH domain
VKTLWIAYVEALMGEDTQTQAAARTGIAQTTIGRWLNGVKAPTEAAKVAAFAQGYQRNVIEAFVAAGMLTGEQAGRGLPAKSRRFLLDIMRESFPGDAEVIRGAFAQDPLSEPSPSVPDAIAAHEDGSIAGEQESTNET